MLVSTIAIPCHTSCVYVLYFLVLPKNWTRRQEGLVWSLEEGPIFARLACPAIHPSTSSQVPAPKAESKRLYAGRLFAKNKRRLCAPASSARLIADIVLVGCVPPTRLSQASSKRLCMRPAIKSQRGTRLMRLYAASVSSDDEDLVLVINASLWRSTGALARPLLFRQHSVHRMPGIHDKFVKSSAHQHTPKQLASSARRAARRRLLCSLANWLSQPWLPVPPLLLSISMAARLESRSVRSWITVTLSNVPMSRL